MNIKLSKIFLSFLFVLLTAVGASAQGDASTSNGRTPPKEELPKNIKESLEKQRIAKEQKDYDEMLKRGEEALQLSEELQNSFSQSQRLSAQDQKKLERLEKVLKKIRSELGGDGDEGRSSSSDAAESSSEVEEKPSTVVSALNKLQTTAGNLVAELKKTSRFTVSVIAIQSSNALLKIVRFIRFTK